MGNSGSNISRDPLDGSSWLRSVVREHQKKTRAFQVSNFKKFSIQEIASDKFLKIYKASAIFKTTLNKTQKVSWIIKTLPPSLKGHSDYGLYREILLHSVMSRSIKEYLFSIQDRRSRYLLNIPEFVHQERNPYGTYLVLEDIETTKACFQISAKNKASGLSLAQFRIFLGTIAQFHAVGLAWTFTYPEDRVLQAYPYLYKKRTEFNDKKYLEMYGRFLKRLYNSGKLSQRKLDLFQALTKNSNEILEQNLQSDLADSMGGVCLGAPLPSDIVFQSNKSGAPFCAAVTTLHRVHYGHVLKDLADCFYSLPDPIVRHHYMMSLLQTYCTSLTCTAKILKVEDRSGYSFHGLVSKFFEYLPHSILNAIIAHMKKTDPKELDEFCEYGTTSKTGSVSNSYIPLSNERIYFLTSLLNQVYKPI